MRLQVFRKPGKTWKNAVPPLVWFAKEWKKKGLPPRSGAHWKKGDGEGLQERVTLLMISMVKIHGIHPVFGA